MSEKRKTPVEFIARKLEYIIWMRDKDIISAHTAGEWRDKFIAEAKAEEKNHIIFAYNQGRLRGFYGTMQDGEQFYNKEYNEFIRKTEKGD